MATTTVTANHIIHSNGHHHLQPYVMITMSTEPLFSISIFPYVTAMYQHDNNATTSPLRHAIVTVTTYHIHIHIHIQHIIIINTTI